jgi:prolyl oligopeptidase PreP (S9A serine peptidase family)
MADQTITFTNDQTMKQVTMVNEIASKQKALEVLEAEREKIMASNEENTSAKMATTCEHGQILMTINNLYMKVSQPENWQIVQQIKILDGQEYQPPLWRKEFDD